MTPETKKLLDALVEMVRAYCTCDDGKLTCGSHSASARALHVLCDFGRVTITDTAGCHVTARWRDEPKTECDRLRADNEKLRQDVARLLSEVDRLDAELDKIQGR